MAKKTEVIEENDEAIKTKSKTKTEKKKTKKAEKKPAKAEKKKTKKAEKKPAKAEKKKTKKAEKKPAKAEKKKTKKAEKKPAKAEKKKTKKAEKKPAKAEKKKPKKLEEEEKKTLEEELEEQLTDEEIVNFQIEKTDMDKLTHRVCEILAAADSEGLFQSDLWKKLKVSSRDGSRLALRLERLGIISREKILEKGRWTYKLVLEKTPVSTESIENSPCLTCPVEQKCTIDGEVSPRTCQWIEDWVLIETSSKKKA